MAGLSRRCRFQKAALFTRPPGNTTKGVRRVRAVRGNPSFPLWGVSSTPDFPPEGACP